jgi:hypothetical protein
VCVYVDVCFAKCVLLQLLVSPNAISFLCCKIHLGKFFFKIYTMDIVLMAKATLVVAMDDLDFGIKDVTFEAKVFNRYGTFNQMQIGAWKI